ncbi:MAG: hypothetical protein HYV05_06850 [Deltaproteobacteria bacterium]|nr:hypothetical protein [Deltaproteobacteria bacterium]MBI2348361.1 hypothetical protein [Deltaproteobacteria bacterium]MBI3060469.1 hypothetical protein [Deltaproteobacteria bacterium]
MGTGPTAVRSDPYASTESDPHADSYAGASSGANTESCTGAERYAGARSRAGAGSCACVKAIRPG